MYVLTYKTAWGQQAVTAPGNPSGKRTLDALVHRMGDRAWGCRTRYVNLARCVNG